MLCLLFHLGSERYALEAAAVLEVIPLVKIKELPQTPLGVAGLINYRGHLIPLLDLSELATGKPAPRKLSTRIIVVDYRACSGGDHFLALLAEKATETARFAETDFQPPGVQPPGAPYLGPVARHSGGIVQKVLISQLIPVEVQNLLFTKANG
ncbi:MAG: chemotaxis protein CheW [Verrucomicrobiales bacterium]